MIIAGKIRLAHDNNLNQCRPALNLKQDDTAMTAHHGPYIRLNEAILREKAGRTDDPRHTFYEAMLTSNSYEGYYRKVDGLKVRPATFRSRPVTARMEMNYARTQMEWVIDSK